MERVLLLRGATAKGSVLAADDDDPNASTDVEATNARSAFYHDTAKSRLAARQEYIDAIDSKTTSFFTIGSTILPIVAGFLSSENSSVADSLAAEIGLFFGFGAYLGLAICYVASLRPGKWAASPDMEQWREVGLHHSLRDSFVEAYRINEPNVERKAARSALAIWFLFVEVVGLSISVLAPFWPPW